MTPSFGPEMEKAGDPENGVQHYESRILDPDTPLPDFIEAMKSGETLRSEAI